MPPLRQQFLHRRKVLLPCGLVHDDVPFAVELVRDIWCQAGPDRLGSGGGGTGCSRGEGAAGETIATP
jgi:hypothetical protein